MGGSSIARHRAAVCVAVALALGCIDAGAQKGPLQPGEYLDTSEGRLVIKPGKSGDLAFSMQTFGSNFTACKAEGVIGRNNVATLRDGPGTCSLSFAPTAEGIDVTTKGQCNAFCGASATLDGLFVKTEPGCDRAGVAKSRNDFKRLYDQKSYAEARATLEPVLKRCSKTLGDRDGGWVRNDLALAYLRLGNPEDCRKVLEPLAANAAKSDAALRDDVPPDVADRLLPVVRAARTNLKLCQAAAGKTR